MRMLFYYYIVLPKVVYSSLNPSWYYIFQFLREGTETITRSRIAFHPKPNDHERDVICRAENTNIANSAIESSYKLTIHCK